MKYVLSRVLLGAAIVWLSGCAAPMPLTGKTTDLVLEKQSFVLASLEVWRRDSKRMVPRASQVLVSPEGQNAGSHMKPFAIDEEGMDSRDGTRSVALIRIALPPGRYSLSSALGRITAFPFFGSWQLPLNFAFDLPEKSVVYVGRISAELRPREKDEFRAGNLIPLVDQAVTGISGGTFDVVVSDQSAVDLERFRASFPVLRAAAIRTEILPQFDRRPIDRAFNGTK